MQLQMFRTLWGAQGTPDGIAAAARAAGYDGLEGQVPLTPGARGELAEALAAHGLAYIAEVTTAGSYVPDRRAGVDEHLDSLSVCLVAARHLPVQAVNCIGGCDGWPLADTLRFLRGARALAADFGLPIRFETHRARSLFNPFVTRDVLECMPELELTLDLSHWCVVCERLLDDELDHVRSIARHARHIHARVGYDQGPQVPHPADPAYAAALAAHQRWWAYAWEAQAAAGIARITMTPEAGPDGYLHCAPFSGTPVADLEEVNAWVLAATRTQFAAWQAGRRPGAAA